MVLEGSSRPRPTSFVSLDLAEARGGSSDGISRSSVVTDAKTVPTDDLEVPSLEPPHASAKSKKTKEAGLGLNDPSKVVKIMAHLDPK